MAIRTNHAFRDDYNIGVGADLASGSPMGFVVDGAAEGVQSAGGATVNFTVRRIHTTEELHRSLGIDAEASFGSGLFGGRFFGSFFASRKIRPVQTSSLFLLLNFRRLAWSTSPLRLHDLHRVPHSSSTSPRSSRSVSAICSFGDSTVAASSSVCSARRAQ